MASSGEDSKKKLQLYSFWRSSCSFRVRFALNLKGLDFETKTVDLLNGEQYSPEFLKLNPIHTVPVLVDGDVVVADSVAIIMYLEEKFPQHPLLPQDIQKRALNFQAANIICTSIQPYQNLPALKMVAEKLGADEVVPFILEQIKKGFGALEKLLKDYSGKYATGDEVYLADLCIAPQIDAAVGRFNLDMNEFPLLLRFYEAYKELPAFQNALPGKQPDAPIELRI